MGRACAPDDDQAWDSRKSRGTPATKRSIAMAIKVRLNGSTVTVHPMVHPVNKGNRPVEWGPHENSDTFTFATPPITFDDRSEERRVGKECVSTFRSGWSP